MSKTLLDLAKDMDSTTASLKLEASRCAVETAKVIHHNLTKVTPVDTSTALSNWDIFLGSFSSEMHEAYFLGKRGSTGLKSEKFANKEAESILKEKKPGIPIFIVNSAHYISKLNDGSSRQEPAGFVERAVLLGRRFVKEFKIKLG